MSLTYLTNYSNASLTCIAQDNITQICQGTVAVIPYNQDVVIVLQLVQASAIVLITFVLLFKLIVRGR